VSTAVHLTTLPKQQCRRGAARPLFSAVLLRRWPDSAERSKAAGRGRADPLAEAGDRLRPNSRAHDPCASRTPQFPAAGAVRQIGTGHGARTRPCRCIRPAAPRSPSPGPLLDRGLDAAEPHIRSPPAAAAPRFPVPEGVGPGRAGPICNAASRSQGVIRSARRDRRGSAPSPMAGTRRRCAPDQAAFSAAPSGTSPCAT